MPKAYSGDLRVRVIEMVRAGASRREAAEVFSLADSTAVKWLQRWEKSGSAEAKPRGGSVSPLEVHAMVILEVVRAQPDATFVELLVVLKKRGIRTSRSALWRFFGRHDHLQEEEPLRQRTAAPGCGAGPPQMDSRARPA